jgi:hypothetical protein
LVIGDTTTTIRALDDCDDGNDVNHHDSRPTTHNDDDSGSNDEDSVDAATPT